MSSALIITVGDITAGLLVGWAGNFRFFSSAPAFDVLDGRSFGSAEQASRAANSLSASHGSKSASSGD
jgi:hypothetical protein